MGVLLKPKFEWFEPRTDLDVVKKASVVHEGDNRGEVSGYFFEWGECVIGASQPGECWTPDPSPSKYEGFHQSKIRTDKGFVACGLLVPGHSHPSASVEDSIEHYNDPTQGVALVRAYENGKGGYFTGSMVPWADDRHFALLEASATSGHWVLRTDFTTASGSKQSGWDCIGPCLVARPGAPLRLQNQFAAPEIVKAVSADDQVVAYVGNVQAHLSEEPEMKITTSSNPPVIEPDPVVKVVAMPEEETVETEEEAEEETEDTSDLAEKVAALEAEVGSLRSEQETTAERLDALEAFVAELATEDLQPEDLIEDEALTP